MKLSAVLMWQHRRHGLHASCDALDRTPTRDSLRTAAQQAEEQARPITVVRKCAYRRAANIHVRMTPRRRKAFVNPGSDVSQTRGGSYATFPSSHCCFDGLRVHWDQQPRHDARVRRPRRDNNADADANPILEGFRFERQLRVAELYRQPCAWCYIRNSLQSVQWRCAATTGLRGARSTRLRL
jgi:hypothetical protein